MEQLKSLRLRRRRRATVWLEEVADIGPERTPNIMAEAARRKAVISCNVGDGYNSGDSSAGPSTG